MELKYWYGLLRTLWLGVQGREISRVKAGIFIHILTKSNCTPLPWVKRMPICRA